MCGITGYWSNASLRDAYALANRMADAIQRRGPDSSGVWCDTNQNLAFGHRRLAIQDTSLAGHQPMHSESGRYTIVYNGELYNHFEIRQQLESKRNDYKWRGHSDTETLLAAVDAWGFSRALQHITGMFAIAVFDHHNKKLHLARDRLGEKPLYVGRFGSTVVFGSELAALRVHPHFDGQLDNRALRLFLAHSTVPAPGCIYENVVKLPAGHRMEVDDISEPLPESVPYWSLAEVASLGVANPLSGGVSEVVEQLDQKLHQTVNKRLVSDVPLGAFLSGGFDSSLVVALMQQSSAIPVKTFTIGFEEQGYNEAPFAKEIAGKLGTDHTELYVSAQDALDVIPILPKMFDEPFGDSSQIPTYLVSKLTRGQVTVSLSGDGGDELFAGYSRYQSAQRLFGKLERVPGVLRLSGATISKYLAPALRNLITRLPGTAPLNYQLLRAERLSDFVCSKSTMEVFEAAFLTRWNQQKILKDQPPITPQKILFPPLKSDLQRMMFHDMSFYLPETIMTKVDRSSMYVSLEARAPLLDHELVEFAWRIPDHMRIKDGSGKWLMREVLYRYLPRELMARPKSGFGVPIDSWLRGPLLDWTENLIDAQKLKDQQLFNVKLVRQVWDEHRQGKWDWSHSLWNVLMFQAWIEEHGNL